MEATEQHHLAVQVVGLHGARSRSRLCHVEPPGRLLPPTSLGRTASARAASRVSANSMPAARRQATPSLPGQDADRTPARGWTAHGFDGIAEIVEELAVLPAHDVGLHPRVEGRRPQRRGDGLGAVVGATVVVSDVEDAGGGTRVRLHHAGLEVDGRAHHRHAVDVRKEAQRRPLVSTPFCVHATATPLGAAARSS